MRFLIILMIGVLQGCSSVASNLVYSSMKSGLPSNSVELVNDNQNLLWKYDSSSKDRFTLAEENLTLIQSYQFGEWTWEFWARPGIELDDKTTDLWRDLFLKSSRLNSILLPNPQKTKVEIYILAGKPKNVEIIKNHTKNEIVVPYVHWFDDSNYLPDSFSEKSDLLAETGSMIQLTYFELGLVPHPEENSVSKLKSYTNSNCWRLAFRPALALGTSYRVKPPPSNFEMANQMIESMYSSNPNDAEANLLYGSTLLINDGNKYMERLDLNWPVSGDDKVEIDALMEFCKDYINSGRDPRI